MALQVEQLTTGYLQKREEPKKISHQLNLSLPPKSVVALIGPNGVGKSTLFRTIAGVQPPIEGAVLLHNKPLQSYTARERARQISLVFTGRPQLNYVTIEELVRLGRYPHTGVMGKLSAQDMERVLWAMEETGVVDFRKRYAEELSDGELQKVMVARALAQDTDIMILDEPAAFLDVGHRIELMGLLTYIAEEIGRSILISSHDLELVYYTSHRVWLMGRDGAVAEGSPQELMQPAALKEVFIQDKKHPVLFNNPTGRGVNLYEIYQGLPKNRE